MSLDKAMKNLKFDSRMQEYNLNNGLLTQDELNKHIESLPDASSNVELIDIDDAADEDDLDEAH